MNFVKIFPDTNIHCYPLSQCTYRLKLHIFITLFQTLFVIHCWGRGASRCSKIAGIAGISKNTLHTCSEADKWNQMFCIPQMAQTLSEKLFLGGGAGMFKRDIWAHFPPRNVFTNYLESQTTNKHSSTRFWIYCEHILRGLFGVNGISHLEWNHEAKLLKALGILERKSVMSKLKHGMDSGVFSASMMPHTVSYPWEILLWFWIHQILGTRVWRILKITYLPWNLKFFDPYIKKVYILSDSIITVVYITSALISTNSYYSNVFIDSAAFKTIIALHANCMNKSLLSLTFDPCFESLQWAL